MKTETDFLNAAIRLNTGAWFETYGRIWPKDRNSGLITPRQNYLQKKIQDVIHKFEELDLPCRIIGLKPRQKGSTTYFSACGYTKMRRQPTSACVIGGQYSQTDELWKMLQTYASNDRFEWGNKGEINAKAGAYSNGSRLKAETAGDALAGISGTYQFLQATEVARWSKYGVANAGEVLSNILKCVPLLAGTMVILESTAEGNCYDDQTELLTDQGWKFFKDLNGTEEILTKDPVTHKAYYQPKWRPVVHKHTGDMIHFKTRTTNICVTPNHMMWMARQKGPMRFQRADSVIGKTTDYVFDRAMKWDTPGIESIVIPEYRNNKGAGVEIKPAVTVPISVWLRYLGHWLADGHTDYRHGVRRSVTTQVKYVEAFRKSAQDLADVLGCNMKENVHENGFRFSIHNAQLACYLKDYRRPKRIPRELLMKLSPAQCKELMLAIYEGDGCLGRREGYKVCRGAICVGIDKELQDDVQELALKMEYATSAYGPPRNRMATFTSSKRAMVRHDNPPKVIHGYDGMVYCVSLPKDHLLMVRRGGTATWCGNSGEYYERYIKAIKMDDFLSGRVIPNPGQYVAVFAPWFEFEDSAVRLSDDQKKLIENTLDEDEEFSGERELIEKYGVVGEDGVQRLGTAVQDYDVWEQLAWRRQAIREECKRDKAIFDRDYPHSAEDAFMKSGNTRFSTIGLSVLRKNAARIVPQPGIIEEVAHGRVAFRQTGVGESTVTIFEKPIPGMRYIQAVDPMTGITQTGGDDPDWHAAFVLRAGYYDSHGKWIKPCTAARVIPCRWEIDMLEKWVWRLARMYGSTSGCKIVIEMNQDRGITELLKLRGADLYQREMFNQREHMMSKALGYHTNVKTREVLVERLATAIRDHDVPGSGIDIWCPHAIVQAENFIRKENGRSEAAEGHKDDDMFSIGLGLTVIDHATVYMPPRSILGWFQPPEFGGVSAGPKASPYS